MSITKDQALIDAQAERDAIVAAANARFIADADTQIQKAIDQGMFFVNCESVDDIDPQQIAQYYADLGYSVVFPDYPRDATFQPSNLFGQAWSDFWAGVLPPRFYKKPIRIIIGWNP